MIPNLQKQGTAVLAAVLWFCSPTLVTPALARQLPATGQTTAYQANKNDGIVGDVDIPDDGTLQHGATLRYKVRQDGTIKDLNTGLIWEVKCSGCGGLHDVNNTYSWSGDDSLETAWDWLDDINAEGRTGYAGHHDWRIPNVKELQSLVDYGRFNPTIDPVFNNGSDSFTASAFYWSSTTTTTDPSGAWHVGFYFGFVDTIDKGSPFGCVRAVRGGSE